LSYECPIVERAWFDESVRRWPRDSAAVIEGRPESIGQPNQVYCGNTCGGQKLFFKLIVRDLVGLRCLSVHRQCDCKYTGAKNCVRPVKAQFLFTKSLEVKKDCSVANIRI
jgi:hypothetical protein